MKINQYFRQAKQLALRAACLLMMIVAVWSSTFTTPAYAAGSTKAADIINERAATELDSVVGAGTSDQLEGAVEGVVGKAKRGIGRVSGDLNDLDAVGKRLDGAADEIEGKVKRDIGRTKSAVDDIGDDLEDEADGFVESLKSLFD